MSNDRKRARETADVLSKYSLTIVEERNGKHRVLRVRNKNGVEAHLTVGRTASDYRAMKNFDKICREISERTT